MDSAQVIDKLSDKLDMAVKEALPHVLFAFKVQNIGNVITGVFLWLLVGIAGFITWKLYKKGSSADGMGWYIPVMALTGFFFLLTTAATCIEGPRIFAAILDPMGAFILKCVAK